MKQHYLDRAAKDCAIAVKAFVINEHNFSGRDTAMDLATEYCLRRFQVMLAERYRAREYLRVIVALHMGWELPQ